MPATQEALVSIILTTLNSERYVARSIESCLHQTHSNLELLIVDGGSDDRTLEAVSSFGDKRIRVIHQPDNSGKLPGAINLGLANARGDFITWTQDDSWYELHAIETMLSFLEAYPAVALVYADYWDVDEAGNRIRYEAVNTPDFILVDDVVRVCFLFRREVYEVLGPQDTEYFPVHEVPWRIKVNNAFKMQPLHMALMHYTMHPGSLTGRLGPWALQYLTADALFKEGYLDSKAYRHRLGQIHIENAYDEFILQGNYQASVTHALSGLRHDPRWFGNWGLIKLIVASLLPVRDAYRRRLYSRWEMHTAAQQAALIEEFAP